MLTKLNQDFVPVFPFSGLKEEIENYEHYGDQMSVSMDTTIQRDLLRDAFTREEPLPRMEDTLEVIQRRLGGKRREASRPEDLDVSNTKGHFYSLSF